MSVIFETKVVAIGPEALGMIEGANMLILFGEEAPADLAEFCFS
ncbi:PTS glucitol/sorbitol transporter subunit IIA, partial [Streptococcus pyogenes]